MLLVASCWLLVVSCAVGLWARVLKGGYIKDCQRIFRQFRHLAKVLIADAVALRAPR